MSMIPVKVPTLGESVSEATIARWIKSDGDYVTPNDAIAELETDKANVEIVPDAPGILKTLRKKGDTVAVGEPIGEVDTAGKAGAAAAPSTSPPAANTPASSGNSVNLKSTPLDDLSPAVRTLILENKLQTATIPATGPGNRLTKEDVLTFLEKQSAIASPPAATPDSAAAANSTRQQSPGGSLSATGTTNVPARTRPDAAPAAQSAPSRALAPDEEREEMSKLRQTIARRLVESQHTTASLTTYNEIDMSAVMALREKYKSDFEKTHGIGLGFMSFFAKAVISALRAVPQVNASIDGNTLIKRKNVHLGVAVSTEKGLMVPVIKNAQSLSMAQIESEIKRLALKARDGKIAVDDMTGGTFTITNGGVFGSLLSTPILNPPQSGILGMHKIEKRAVVITEAGKDTIVVRPMMYVALTYDHRVIDGKQSVTFLVKIKEALEDPARMLLEM